MAEVGCNWAGFGFPNLHSLVIALKRAVDIDEGPTVHSSAPHDNRCLLKMSLHASFLNGQKRQIMTTPDPGAPKTKCGTSAEKTVSSTTMVKNFLSVPLLEEYYNPTQTHEQKVYGLDEETTYQATECKHLQKMNIINPLVQPSMEEEEVSLVDGVFEGVFGALALEMEALDCHGVYGDEIMDGRNDE
ncbi:hypothetical protein Tco_1466403 [Tanacetum coccineum]